MDLKYGKGSIRFEPPPGMMGVVEPRTAEVRPVRVLLKESFSSPVGQAALGRALRRNKPGDVVIIVSDITRKISNYEEILSFLVAELVDAGVDEKNISFVVALGTHRRHTDSESSQLYGRLRDEFSFLEHDCHRDLVPLGQTSTGLEVSINRRVQEADFVIATGRVGFHYLAGYSGGRKSILPGVAAYETIRSNHSKLVRNGVFVGKREGNIIAEEMADAGRLLAVDFLLNVVEASDRETARIFCGHHEHAFDEAVKYLIRTRGSRIPELADCAIVSAGGYPGDRDFYHTHKAINLAMLCLNRHGSIILAGECAEGFGNEKFMELMLNNELNELIHHPEEKIEVGGHRAYLTAKILKDHRVYVCADLDPVILKRMKFTPVQNIQQGIDAVVRENGSDLKTLVVPDGAAVLPLFNGRKNVVFPTGG
ncbi:MAG: nickel-dependent lactate racemase [candidate division WOR-3 bacterium]|nr:MAG: nickel-dependent lactate racemase [candidate division WOR-3 bacterium]